METPEFFHCNAPFPSEKRLSDAKAIDHFIIDDLLDFPNNDVTDAPASADSSSATPLDTSCNSSSFSTPAADPYFQPADAAGNRSFVDGHFSNELCVPYDELAELEWLSNMVDESFSSEDMQKLHLIQGMKARTNEAPTAQHYNFEPEPTRSGPTRLSGVSVSVPARASARPLPRAAGLPASSWWRHPRPLMPPPCRPRRSPMRPPPRSPRRPDAEEEGGGRGGELWRGRGAEVPPLHHRQDAAVEDRAHGPQDVVQRVRGQVQVGAARPEYRPAASPTFVLTKHSNSHRKVLELRRQKEMVRAQQHQHLFMHHHHHHQSMMFDVSNGDNYLIHQHIGPGFRQLI